MKRILIILALALVASVSVNAQIKYKDLKAQYNYKEYTPQDIDPYRRWKLGSGQRDRRQRQ